MASACVNNVSVSPEGFPGKTYGWLGSGKVAAAKVKSPAKESVDLEVSGGDFEFRLEDPVGMLPADELFSDGKLVPLQISSMRAPPVNGGSVRSTPAARVDPYLFSPKAPRCSSRWRELLGLKKQRSGGESSVKTPSFCASSTSNLSSSSNTSKALKIFLHRSSKSSDQSLNLPLLDGESVSTVSSSRLSLSSSSSGHDHDDHRLSLDSDKTTPNPFKSQNPNPNPLRMRFVRPATNTTVAGASRAGRSPIRSESSSGVSVDSPRMNSSGKIVFQSLERSSSSPSSFNGGPRFKHRGMERSYSANVRVTPVLNVPVCSLPVFGFGQLFSSPQKRDGNNGAAGTGNRTRNRTGPAKKSNDPTRPEL